MDLAHPRVRHQPGRADGALCRRPGAKRLSLVTPASLSGQTFLSWFAFFARDLAMPTTRFASMLEPETSCEAPMARALAFQPDMLFIVGATPSITTARPEPRGGLMPPVIPRLLWADTGLDTLGMLRALGPLAEGLETALRRSRRATVRSQDLRPRLRPSLGRSPAAWSQRARCHPAFWRMA